MGDFIREFFELLGFTRVKVEGLVWVGRVLGAGCHVVHLPLVLGLLV